MANFNACDLYSVSNIFRRGRDWRIGSNLVRGGVGTKGSVRRKDFLKSALRSLREQLRREPNKQVTFGTRVRCRE